MDLTKFFLYTSLAVITYLMLLAWQEDYPPLVGGGSQQSTSLQFQKHLLHRSVMSQQKFQLRHQVRFLMSQPSRLYLPAQVLQLPV